MIRILFTTLLFMVVFWGTPVRAQTPDPRSTSIVPPTDARSSAYDTMDLILGPPDVKAQVGSEVILVCGVRDQNGYLRTNQKILWNISSDSVGHFAKISDRDLTNILVGDFGVPKIENDTLATSSTLRSQRILDRGTPNPNDDVVVRPGETWISISSPREGITYVTASAPNIVDSKNKTQICKITWVDAEYKLPESLVLDFGTRYTMETVLRRRSDTRPLTNWRVRYEICGNSSATFADGNKMLEVLTSAEGKAKLEILQPIARAEDTVVRVQIIRPAEYGTTFTQPVVVHDSKVRYRWQPNTINVQKSMSKEAYVGSVITAVVTISNLTEGTLEKVRVVEQVPEGVKLTGAYPVGSASVDGTEWLFTSLAPLESKSIQLNYQVERPGTYQLSTRATVQKLGNELVVEASNELNAGGETSPFVANPESAAADPNAAGSGPTQALPPPPMEEESPSATPKKTFVDPNSYPSTEDSAVKNSEMPPSVPPLVPESLETPESPESLETPKNPEHTENPDVIPLPITRPDSPTEVSPYSPPSVPGTAALPPIPKAYALVFPQESPDVLISLEIQTNATARLREEFNVYIDIVNRTATDQQNVEMHIMNTKGLVYSQRVEGQNPYYAMRKLDWMKPGQRKRLLAVFMPVFAGDQTITVSVTLQDKTTYRRYVTVRVMDPSGKNLSVPNSVPASVPPSIPAPVPAPEISAPIPVPAPTLDEVPDIVPELPSDNDSSSKPEPEAFPPTENLTPEEPPAPEELSTPEELPAPEAPSEAVKIPANPLPPGEPKKIGDLIQNESEDAASSELAMSLTESKSKIAVGDAFEYNLSITNTTSAPAEKVAIWFMLPAENMEIVQSDVRGPTEATVDVKNGLVRFSAIDSIPPGASVECKVPVKALKSGIIEAHVKFLRDGSPWLEKTRETKIE